MYLHCRLTVLAGYQGPDSLGSHTRGCQKPPSGSKGLETLAASQDVRLRPTETGYLTPSMSTSNWGDLLGSSGNRSSLSLGEVDEYIPRLGTPTLVSFVLVRVCAISISCSGGIVLI